MSEQEHEQILLADARKKLAFNRQRVEVFENALEDAKRWLVELENREQTSLRNLEILAERER